MLLARKATGRRATYRKGEGRDRLVEDESFAEAFRDAKARIRGMTVQFVGFKDPGLEAMFEIYAARRFGTPYNDFDTH